MSSSSIYFTDSIYCSGLISLGTLPGMGKKKTQKSSEHLLPEADKGNLYSMEQKMAQHLYDP